MIAAGASRYWNWKSAVLSTALRASIFFICNLPAGLPAALDAFVTEACFRAVGSGFYGAMTQGLLGVHRRGLATGLAIVMLPILNHSMEFGIHWLRGTPELALSIGISMAFTALSSAFNLFAMRHGALVAGPGGDSLRRDLARLPGLLLTFFHVQIRRPRRCHSKAYT